MASNTEATTPKLEKGRANAASVEPKVIAKPNARMYVAIATAMAGAIMFGLDQGNFGNVQSFEDFRKEWCVGKYGDELTCSNDKDMGAAKNVAWQNGFVLLGASLITFGAAAGGLILGPLLSDKAGRRPCVSIGSGICSMGCVMTSYLSFGKVCIFFAGRILTGFGVGVCCFALPLYNSEIATPAIRGTTGSLFQLNVVIGGFIATLVTLTNQDWRFGMLLPGIAGAIVAAAVWLTPESPRYVMEKKGYEAGLAVLRTVRRGDVSVEANDMKAELEAEAAAGQVTYCDIVKNSSLRHRVLIAVWLQVAQQLTGVNAFLGYATTLFADIGIDEPLIFNVIWNAVMILACVLGLSLIDSKFGGRRSQLLGATALMGPALVVAGLALLYHLPGFLSMLMLCIYGVGFQLAWGTVPWIYPSEIFNMAEKDRAVSLAVFLQYLSNAAIVVMTPLIMTTSVPGTLFTFGGLNILNFFFVLVYIKETKGVPLEHIPALFGHDDGVDCSVQSKHVEGANSESSKRCCEDVALDSF